MPQLSFPVTSSGLTVDVRVNLDATTLRSLLAGGGLPPPSATARGVIDTGSDVSAVAGTLLQQLAVPLRYSTMTQGIGGPVPVRLFSVTLFLYDAVHPQLPWLSVPDILVMELPPGFPVEVLIGMDVLRTCRLELDGPAGRFALDF
jgi:hypothetical protein